MRTGKLPQISSLSCKVISPGKGERKLLVPTLTKITHFGCLHRQSIKIKPFFFLFWHQVVRYLQKWHCNHGEQYFNIFINVSNLHLNFSENFFTKKDQVVGQKWSEEWRGCTFIWPPALITAHEAQDILAKFLKTSSPVGGNQSHTAHMNR